MVASILRPSFFFFSLFSHNSLDPNHDQRVRMIRSIVWMEDAFPPLGSVMETLTVPIMKMRNTVKQCALMISSCAGTRERLGRTKCRVAFPRSGCVMENWTVMINRMRRTVIGPIDCANQTPSSRGVFGLYRGLSVLFYGSIPKSSFRFGTFEYLKGKAADEKGYLSPSMRLLCGLGAGLSEAVFAVTPMETVKVKLIHDRTLPEPRFKGFAHGVATIVKTEGVGGLYRVSKMSLSLPGYYPDDTQSTIGNSLMVFFTDNWKPCAVVLVVLLLILAIVLLGYWKCTRYPHRSRSIRDLVWDGTYQVLSSSLNSLVSVGAESIRRIATFRGTPPTSSPNLISLENGDQERIGEAVQHDLNPFDEIVLDEEEKLMDAHSMGRLDWLDSVPYDDNRSMMEMGRGAYTDCFSYSSSNSTTFTSDPIWSPSLPSEDPFLRPSTILSSLPTPLLQSPPSPKPLNSWQVKKGPGAPSLNHLIVTTEPNEVFARKVFVGGLPIDVSEEEISSTFSHFGRVLVDWPRRPDTARDAVNESRHMTGYVFLVFEQEQSVQALVKECHLENGRYYLFVSSPTMRDKPVQVRPWRLRYFHGPSVDREQLINEELDREEEKILNRSSSMESLYSTTSSTSSIPSMDNRPIFDPFFTPREAKTINFEIRPFPSETKKRVEIKPYVMDDQMCDECHGKSCSSRYAPYFCGDVSCLQYYCETCWDSMHLAGPLAHKRANHRPLIRQGDQTKLLARPSHHQTPRRASSTIRPLRLY